MAALRNIPVAIWVFFRLSANQDQYEVNDYFVLFFYLFKSISLL